TPLPPLPQQRNFPRQETIIESQDIRTLPGQLDRIPVFNSNSPEVVYDQGILVSTFPAQGMTAANAHLNLPLEGRFDIFAHHIARGRTEADWRPIYHGILVYNPNPQPTTVRILQGLSYVTNPDAPFIDLPASVENNSGSVYSGPGSRLANDILRGLHQADFPRQIVIPPRQSRMLLNAPIHLGNARSTLIRAQSDNPVYLASLALPAPILEDNKNPEGTEVVEGAKFDLEPEIPPEPVPHRPPTILEWETVLVRGYLVTPRDRPPTPPGAKINEIVYGRVAGVAQGSQWQAVVTDEGNREHLTIPRSGEAFSYPISSLQDGTLGTNQVQSAPMLARYPDTAYLANGNYGVRYYLTMPLYNDTDRAQTVTIALQTPLKREEKDRLYFLNPPDERVFFRGTVHIRHTDERGILRSRAVHLVQRRGQQGDPLLTLTIPPRSERQVKVDFIYPADATPPQVMTVQTLE
ncbi:MAG: DUF3370 domain-containing protein, partial [Jaaginema sp. PMC 1078.18]|nr:DUF3370 domain-containing protein [Jaaginema sp. PMC 1078.18]